MQKEKKEEQKKFNANPKYGQKSKNQKAPKIVNFAPIFVIPVANVFISPRLIYLIHFAHLRLRFSPWPRTAK